MDDRRDHSQSEERFVLPILEYLTLKEFDAIAPTILLATNSLKPSEAISDEVWYKFRSNAIEELSAFRSNYNRDCFFSFVILLLPGLPLLSIFHENLFPIIPGVAMTLLTTACWCHCGFHPLRFHLPALFAKAVYDVVAGFARQDYVNSMNQALSAGVFLYYMSCSSVQDQFVRDWASTVNMHCRCNLGGYAVMYEEGKTTEAPARRRGNLVFSRQVHSEGSNDTEAHGLDASDNRDVPSAGNGVAGGHSRKFEQSKDEFKVFLDSYSLEHERRQPHAFYASCFYLLSETSIPPPGIQSYQGWLTLCQDVSDDIKRHRKLARKIHRVVGVNVTLSIVFACFGRFNFLLPLHLSPVLLVKRHLQSKLKKKFEIIDKLGCSPFGQQYQMSYHQSLPFYSESNGFLLFKHREIR